MNFEDFGYTQLCFLENKLINAVASGELQNALAIIENFTFLNGDATPAVKAYCFALNALLRKATELVKVPTEVIVDISQETITEIRLSVSLKEVFKKAVASYCNLVISHSQSPYSAPVRKAIIKIESDLESDVSLKALSRYNNMSAGYFSGLFKKETGATLTDFVNRKRIERAKKLISSSSLEIKEISRKCGIDDTNYFAKLFKKYEGISPSNYRKTKRNESL